MFDIPPRPAPPAPNPIQFVDIKITPLIDGKFAVAMQATLLDEQELEFLGQDLAYEHVASLDDVLGVIRKNVVPLAAELLPAGQP